MNPIRIAIADDHGIVRSGLRQLLASVPGHSVVCEASNGPELLGQLRSTQVDLVLLDLSMPGLSGLDLIRRLQILQPQLPILVLSMHVEAQIVARVLRAGAAGFVAKDSNADTLIAAVRKVATQGRFIDPALVDSVVFLSAVPSTEEPHAQLSPRELQVLERIGRGQPLGQIADELHLSPKTVSTHKMRLMQKLSVQTNADLLKYAMRHGLTTV